MISGENCIPSRDEDAEIEREGPRAKDHSRNMSEAVGVKNRKSVVKLRS